MTRGKIRNLIFLLLHSKSSSVDAYDDLIYTSRTLEWTSNYVPAMWAWDIVPWIHFQIHSALKGKKNKAVFDYWILNLNISSFFLNIYYSISINLWFYFVACFISWQLRGVIVARHRTAPDRSIGVGVGGHLGTSVGLATVSAHGRALRRVSLHGHFRAERYPVLGSLYTALQAC